MAKSQAKPAPMYNDFSGGENVRDSANALKDNEAALAQNCFFSFKGRVDKRPGWQVLIGTACPTAGNLIGAYHAGFISGLVVTRYMVATDGVTIYYWTGTVWTQITGALTLSVSQKAIVRFVQMNNLVIGYDGENAPWEWPGTGSAALVGGNPPIAPISFVYNDRLWWAAGTRLYYSELGDTETYLSTSYIDVPSQFDGEIINGLTVMYGNLYILKRFSIYTLSGADPTTFVLNRTNASVGSVSDMGIAQSGNLIYFISDKGLHAMNIFNVKELGYKVEPRYLNAVANQLQNGLLFQNRIMMYHYRTRGHLFVAIDDSVSGQNTHTKLMVHDYQTIDKDTGDPAASEYVRASGISGATAPAFMLDYHYPGSDQIVPAASFYDKFLYYLVEGTTADEDSSTSALNIVMKWVSKYFDWGDSEAIKHIRWHWITGIFNGGTPKYTVTKSDNLGVSSTGATLTPASGFYNQRGLFPSSALDPVAAKYFQFGFQSDDGGLFTLYSFTFDLLWKGRRY